MVLPGLPQTKPHTPTSPNHGRSGRSVTRLPPLQQSRPSVDSDDGNSVSSAHNDNHQPEEHLPRDCSLRVRCELPEPPQVRRAPERNHSDPRRPNRHKLAEVLEPRPPESRDVAGLRDGLKTLLAPRPPVHAPSAQRPKGTTSHSLCVVTVPTSPPQPCGGVRSPRSAALDSPTHKSPAFSWVDPNAPAVFTTLWNDNAVKQDAPLRARRSAVSSRVVQVDQNELFEVHVHPKEPLELEKLRGTLHLNPLFSQLDEEDLRLVQDAMTPLSVPAGDNVLNQGAANESFYVISSGTCHVHKDGQLVAILKEGQSFGELELMYQTTCYATVKAVTHVDLWVLNQDVYRHILMQVSIQKRQLYEDLLLRMKFLQGMDHYQLMVLADALQPATFHPGDYLIRRGEEGGWMHIVLDGQVEVLGVDADGNEVHVCEFGWGDSVGELEFLNNHPCIADVRAVVDTKTVKLHRDHFEMCMGPIAAYLKDRAEVNSEFTYYQQKKKAEVPFDFTKNAGMQLFEPSSRTSSPHRSTSSPHQTISPRAASPHSMSPISPQHEDRAFRRPTRENQRNSRRRASDKRRRVAVSAAWTELSEDFSPVVVHKTPEEVAVLKNRLAKNPLFAEMNQKELQVVLDAMKPATYMAQEYILRKGDHNDYYQVITSGECLFDDGIFSRTLHVGEAFGELELMYDNPCVGSLIALTDVETFMLDRQTYRQTVMQISMKKRELYANLLRNVEFLRMMSDYDLLTLADALQSEEFQPGDTIIEYGSTGLWMHIIIEGIVEVQGRDDTGKLIEVCELSACDPIGELEFLHQHRCVADVVAKTFVETVKLNREHFEMCMGPVLDTLKDRENKPEYAYYAALDFEKSLGSFRDQIERQGTLNDAVTSHLRRTAVSAHQDEEGDDATIPVVAKSPETLELLRTILATNPLFTDLEQTELDTLASTMYLMEFLPGHAVLQQGEDNSLFYVIQSGKVVVMKDGQEVSAFGPGRWFGELELMYNGPCQATVVTCTECSCWVMEGPVYRRTVKRMHIEKRALYKELLQGVDFLKGLTDYEFSILADALQPAYYQQGETITRFGEEPEWMYIIVEGEVEVWGRDSTSAVVNVCRCGGGDPIGELEFLNNHKCVADVVAVTAVKMVKLRRQHFELCMGPVLETLRSNVAKESYNHYSGFDWSKADEMASFINKVTELEELRRQTTASPTVREIAIPTPPLRPRQPPTKMGARPRPRRVAVASSVVEPKCDDDFTPAVFPKPKESHQMLKVLLSKKALLSHLEDADMDMLVDSMELKTFQPGDVMIHEEVMGENLFVIMSGKCVKKCRGKVDEVLSRGATLGEEQLMYSSKYTFRVEVMDPTECYVLNRSQYQLIATRVSRMRRELYEDLLSNVSFLASMTHEELLTLADCLRPAHFTESQYIIRFGSEGEWMHIIIDGTVEVWGRDANGATINVCEFGPGDPIGELEFLNNHKCVADVVAKTDVKTVKLNRNHFELCMGPVVDVLKRHAQTETYRYYSAFDWSQNDFTQRLLHEGEETPSSDDRSSDSGASAALRWRKESCKRRSGVTSRRVEQGTAEHFLPIVVPKSEERMQLIVTTMQNKALFSSLEVEDIRTLAEVMVENVYQKGDCIVREAGEDDHFYIIALGTCEWVDQERQAKVLSVGDCFGELELMYQCPCTATVTVLSDQLVVYLLDQTTYRSVVMQASIRKRKLYEELLSHISILKSMTHKELLDLADALQPSSYQSGDYLIRYGEPGEYMHIILSGEVDVIGRELGRPIHVCTFGYGHPVGELEFLNNHVCVADVVAKTDVKTAKLSRRHFELVMGPVVDVLRRNAEQPVYTYYNQTLALVRSGSFDPVSHPDRSSSSHHH